MEDGGILPVLVENRNGYKNLCELLTGRICAARKGSARFSGMSCRNFAAEVARWVVNASLSASIRVRKRKL